MTNQKDYWQPQIRKCAWTKCRNPANQANKISYGKPNNRQNLYYCEIHWNNTKNEIKETKNFKKTWQPPPKPKHNQTRPPTQPKTAKTWPQPTILQKAQQKTGTITWEQLLERLEIKKRKKTKTHI